jgi:hypothetical protein
MRYFSTPMVSRMGGNGHYRFWGWRGGGNPSAGFDVRHDTGVGQEGSRVLGRPSWSGSGIVPASRS